MEKFSYAMEGDGKPPTDSDEWEAWYRNLRAEANRLWGSDHEPALMLAAGVYEADPDLHRKLAKTYRLRLATPNSTTWET